MLSGHFGTFMNSVQMLSGGAAQGLVTQLQSRFESAYGLGIHGTFSAVGAMKESLLAGTACDVIILTQALIDQLLLSGHLIAGSAQVVGVVKTGVAVKHGHPGPDIGNPAALRTAFEAARGIYFPDPVKATAGIHVLNVLKQLGLEAALANRFRTYPNGALAMKAMADSDEPGLIGSTQITEILNTPGVDLVAPLPKEFELATVYVAAVNTGAAKPKAAQDLINMLISPDAAALRLRCGFEA